MDTAKEIASAIITEHGVLKTIEILGELMDSPEIDPAKALTEKWRDEAGTILDYPGSSQIKNARARTLIECAGEFDTLMTTLMKLPDE